MSKNRLTGIIGACIILVIVVVIATRLPAPEDMTIALEDGASISIPRGGIGPDATVTAAKLDPKNGPEAPQGFTIQTLYEFSVDEPLMEIVTLRLPLVSVTEDEVLWLANHDQTDGVWHGVGFRIEDGYAVVVTDTLSIWGTMIGTWDDFADWASRTVGSMDDWIGNKILPYLTISHWISWYEEVMGADKMIYDPLFTASPELICDHSRSLGLISASARLMSEDRIEIRIRNDTRMYLHLYFDGPSVEPIQRGYLSLADILRFVETTPEMKSVVQSSFLQHGVILLPECTADFRTYMSAVEVLSIKAEMSDAAALINGLDPAFALVPIADLEAATAVRDLKGAQSEFSLALEVYQDEWLWKTIAGLNLVEETMRTGWLLGTRTLRFVANKALVGIPAMTELANQARQRKAEIEDRGGEAILGGRIVVSYREGEEEQTQCSVSIFNTAGGSVTAPGVGTFSYDAGTLVELVAEAQEGYRFVNWTGDVGSIEDPNSCSTSITMNGDYSIRANFEEVLSKQYVAVIETIKGDLVLELFASDVPMTVNNFVTLAREGFYDGLTFHRVIPGFMAQGGCPVGDGTGGPGYRFDDEITDHKHGTGALSMANAGPNTNGSQFFITYAPQPHLDGKHTVFGKLLQGMDVLESLVNGDVMIRVTIQECDRLPPDPKTYPAPPPMTIDQNKQYIATIETAKGVLVLELFAGDVPITVNSFVFLAREGFYAGLTFHRVIPGFMAQGGCPVGDGAGGPGYRFDDEITDHKHGTGALSMANAGPNTNGSQFFITYAPQPHLDGKHTVFGKLLQGMDVLEKLENGDFIIRITIEERDS